MRRAADPDPSDRVHDDLAWAALRAYQIDTGDYSGQTRLGLRIRATGQLSGRLDRLSAMVRQRVPTWDGARWTAPAATSNPAWLFRWYARGVFVSPAAWSPASACRMRASTRTRSRPGAHGARARGSAAISCSTAPAPMPTCWRSIAQCGRASPSWQTGRLGVVWEDAGRPATALVTPGNIVAGSFAVEYAAGQAADEIAVRYIEPDLDWQFNTLRRLAPGASGPPASHDHDHPAKA